MAHVAASLPQLGCLRLGKGCFEVRSFSRNISCALSRKRHSSGKSLAAHLIVRISRPQNKRLLWPAPVKETMASRCSWRSPAGPGALIGDSLTWGSEAIPVLLRPCSLIALRTSLYRPHQAVPAAVCRALRGPPTSPFMALLMGPRAVKAQARVPRSYSVCGCEAAKSSAAPGPWRSDQRCVPFPSGGVAVSTQNFC